MGDTNALPFTAKLSKESIKLSKERYVEYHKLCNEYVIIEEDKRILAKKNSDLQTSRDALQKLTARCQCQSDDRQLANNEVMLNELQNEFNDISTIEMGDLSEWENNDNDNQNLDDKLLELLVTRINTIKVRIDVSKQLIKVALRLKHQYEVSNSKLKHKLAECHCAEDCARDDIELRKKYFEERTSNDSKKQYSIVKEGSYDKNKYVNNTGIKESSIETSAKTKSGDKLAKTVEKVVSGNHLKQKRKVSFNDERCTASKHNNNNDEEKLMNGLVIEYINNKNEYKCQLNGCNFVCLTLHALAVHKGHKHKRNKKKSKLRFVVKRKSVQRESIVQSNANVDNNVTMLANNTDNDDNVEDDISDSNSNANSVYDTIIPLVIPKIEQINQTASQHSINNFDDNNINQINDNSLIRLNHCTANSPQMDEQLSPVADKTLKCHLTGCGFSGEDGVELKTHIKNTHKSNQNGNKCYKQYACYYSKCDFVGLSRVMLKKHMANHCDFPGCNFVAFGRVMLKKHIASMHNKYRNETEKSMQKSFVCRYPNCVYGSNTRKGLRIHFKRIHGKSMAIYSRHKKLKNRSFNLQNTANLSKANLCEFDARVDQYCFAFGMTNVS